jgi:hypothetical protein
MRKFALVLSTSAAALMVTACGPAPKETEAPAAEETVVDNSEMAAPANAAAGTDANAADAMIAAPNNAVSNATAEDDDRGGDPGARRPN